MPENVVVHISQHRLVAGENGKRRMNHHHDSFISGILAVTLVTMPWWIRLIEEFSGLTGKFLLPLLGVVLVVLQIWYVIRKHRALENNKPE